MKNRERIALIESLFMLGVLIFVCSFACKMGSHAAAQALGVCQ